MSRSSNVQLGSGVDARLHEIHGVDHAAYNDPDATGFEEPMLETRCSAVRASRCSCAVLEGTVDDECLGPVDICEACHCVIVRDVVQIIGRVLGVTSTFCACSTEAFDGMRLVLVRRCVVVMVVARVRVCVGAIEPDTRKDTQSSATQEIGRYASTRATS